jgi:hypothetical protein
LCDPVNAVIKVVRHHNADGVAGNGVAGHNADIRRSLHNKRCVVHFFVLSGRGRGVVSPSYTDEQIRELCARALAAKGLEFEAVISKLRVALRNHAESLSNLAVAMLLQMPKRRSAGEESPEPEEERKDGT